MIAELRCAGIAKSYGARTVLDDVDLLVPAGTLTAILGASGSGKTTLLRIVIGFIQPDRGSVTVGERVVVEAGRLQLAPDKRAIGYVAQEGALFPHLTVAENVAFGLPRAERRRASRVGEMLELVGLAQEYANHRPHELSGGEQRRVALARARAPRPRRVLVDEPFSGLDAALRAETRAAVLAALAGEGATTVLVTHDQAEALSMGREVAVLQGGRLVQTAAPAVLYRAPADLEVARFVGEAVVVAGHVRSPGLVDCVLGALRCREGSLLGAVQVMVRPEQIRLTRRSPGASGREAAPVAEVVGHTYQGADTLVQALLDDGARTPVAARTFEHELPAAGELVEVAVSGTVVVYPPAQPR